MSPSHASINFKGWDAVSLENGLLRLVAVPDIGGRIMACDLGPYPYFFVDPVLAGKLFSARENQGDGSLAAWKNYGGDKTWPSPQGWDNDDQWHGPPDPILDTGRYTWQAGSDEGHAWIKLVSPAGSSTGIQITRQFTLRPGSSRVAVELSFTNISQRVVRWSIWDVVQLQAARRLPDGSFTHEPQCCVTTRLNPNSRFERGFNVMFGAQENPQWTVDAGRGLFVANYLWEIGKVGIDTTCGWVAFSNAAAGFAFVETFSHFKGEAYPDSGVGVECWTVGRGKVANLDYETSGIYLMETEVLSPFYTFQPGETRSFNMSWGCACCPGVVVDANPAGCAAVPLNIRRQGETLHIRGQYGTFDAGRLFLSIKNTDGALLRTLDLGEVSPLTPVLVDQVLAAPPASALVSLDVRAANGRMHLLATERIEQI